MNNLPKIALGAWAWGNDGTLGTISPPRRSNPSSTRPWPADSICGICRILATYADETVLNGKGKIDYHTFKPVLFEFPTYEYFVTGEKVGDCGRMNAE